MASSSPGTAHSALTAILSLSDGSAPAGGSKMKRLQAPAAGRGSKMKRLKGSGPTPTAAAARRRQRRSADDAPELRELRNELLSLCDSCGRDRAPDAAPPAAEGELAGSEGDEDGDDDDDDEPGPGATASKYTGVCYRTDGNKATPWLARITQGGVHTIWATPEEAAGVDDSELGRPPRRRHGRIRDERRRAAPSLLASFDAAAASSSEDEEEEETSGQRPKSQYRGVCASGSSAKPWRATLKVDGKPVNLGSHATEEEAARVYDKYIREHNLLGTNRRKLNFPLPGEEEAKKPPEKPHARPGSSTKPAAHKKPSVTEQLATARSERDAVRLERDMLRAGRDRRLERAAPASALRSERDAACSDRDTLRSERDAACSERDVLQIQLTSGGRASSSEDEEEEETSGQWPKSQYHGVTTTGNSSKNPWRATTRIRGKPVNLGSHATEEEAARVYDKYLREHNLVGTDHRRKLNFPLPGEEEAAKRAKKPLSRPGPSTKPAARSAAVEIRAERSAAVAAEAAGDTRKPSVTEQLATTRSERDAVRLERDTLRAGRETVASERDALRVELDALRSESAAAVSERNALRAVLDAACAERDATLGARRAQGERGYLALQRQASPSSGPWTPPRAGRAGARAGRAEALHERPPKAKSIEKNR
ncbi:hypothetical protein JL720_15149 [Aureococcus anophagefferens]|nr:hypothetical protein JL720_15149 [Aureococcus anophagefferens]